ncbi:RNA polymerase sigma-70 factor [Brevibacillus ginsengisoli]|uniref:RNA polymerase sigma-70 factor n=1 Tax=Brevibacillus ginsengisoli TaxID=363854 RepID=UPI003CEC5519
MNLTTLYETYQRLLFTIAYGMLGSVTDAEDVVQDLFVSLQTVNLSEIKNMKAFLSKLVTNRSINLLKSSQKKKEVYVGPWLPEPLVNPLDNQPLYLLEREETISYAFMVMLEKLSPIERAVFILREVFLYEYSEIARVLDKSEANCRKILSRVKLKVESVAPTLPATSLEPENQLITQFVSAFTKGNVDGVVDLLVDDVIFYSDGGGKVRTAYKPIYSKKRVLALIRGITGKGYSQIQSHLVWVNGQMGAVITKNQNIKAVFCFGMDDKTGLIQSIYSIVNPEKLQRIVTDSVPYLS